MTLQNLYIKVKKNKISKSQFLTEVRKDPFAAKYVSPSNTYEDVVKILKSKDMIHEMQPKLKSFDLKKYLKEIEDEAPSSEEAEEEPAEQEATLPGDLEDAVNRFIARIEQTADYDSYENVVLMLEKVLKSFKFGKQTRVAILNSVKSKII